MSVTCQYSYEGYIVDLSLLRKRPAAAVNLVGGHLCLDFVNSVGARRIAPSGEMMIRDEKLADYVDLLAWGRHAGVLTDGPAQTLARESSRREKEAAAVFRRAIRLREALYYIFRAILLRKEPEQLHLHVLNEELCLAREAEHLVFQKPHFAWHWGASDSSLDRVVASVARSAAELLTQGDLTRLHKCAGDDCGWIFEDTSRNRGRRWCDMRDCGNVAKVRRFRKRQGS
jgi:predicted RNA-binding Zn ribbon-like protein